MWRKIENSYFWITYRTGSKEITLRFLNPLNTKVIVFKFSFSKEIIHLIGEESHSEKVLLLRKNYQNIIKQIVQESSTYLGKADRLEKELADTKAKLEKLMKEHSI